MRYLAIDLGQKRTGLATGDDTTGLVSPLVVVEIPQGERLLSTLVEHVETQTPDVIVIGLPVNMDGTIGPAAEAARAFGDQLATRTALPVHYQDERLTTFAADQSMARSGLTRGEKKKRRDALAAVEILKDWLEARR